MDTDSHMAVDKLIYNYTNSYTDRFVDATAADQYTDSNGYSVCAKRCDFSF